MVRSHLWDDCTTCLRTSQSLQCQTPMQHLLWQSFITHSAKCFAHLHGSDLRTCMSTLWWRVNVMKHSSAKGHPKHSAAYSSASKGRHRAGERRGHAGALRTLQLRLGCAVGKRERAPLLRLAHQRVYACHDLSPDGRWSWLAYCQKYQRPISKPMPSACLLRCMEPPVCNGKALLFT